MVLNRCFSAIFQVGIWDQSLGVWHPSVQWWHCQCHCCGSWGRGNPTKKERLQVTNRPSRKNSNRATPLFGSFFWNRGLREPLNSGVRFWTRSCGSDFLEHEPWGKWEKNFIHRAMAMAQNKEGTWHHTKLPTVLFFLWICEYEWCHHPFWLAYPYIWTALWQVFSWDIHFLTFFMKIQAGRTANLSLTSSHFTIQGFYLYIRLSWICHLGKQFKHLTSLHVMVNRWKTSSCLTRAWCNKMTSPFRATTNQHWYSDASGLGLRKAGRFSTWFLCGGPTYFHFTPLGDGPINKNMYLCHYVTVSANSHFSSLWNDCRKPLSFGAT